MPGNILKIFHNNVMKCKLPIWFLSTWNLNKVGISYSLSAKLEHVPRKSNKNWIHPKFLKFHIVCWRQTSTFRSSLAWVKDPSKTGIYSKSSWNIFSQNVWTSNQSFTRSSSQNRLAPHEIPTFKRSHRLELLLQFVRSFWRSWWRSSRFQLFIPQRIQFSLVMRMVEQVESF